MPTNQHQEEAREIVESVFGKRGSNPIYATAGRLFDELQTKFASALSARDAEIREVLEGLIVRRFRDYSCWCDDYRFGPHVSACLATQALWEKVQPDSTTDTPGS